MMDAYYLNPRIHHVGAVQPAAYMIPNLPAGAQRESAPGFQLLSGSWDFAWYPSALDVDLEALLRTGAFEAQAQMPVPGCWQTNGFDSAQYITSPYPFLFDPPHVPAENPVGIYRTAFSCRGENLAGVSTLYFEGADSCLYACLNGRLLGYAEGPHNTVGFDVTGLLRENNTLTVAVLKWCSGSYLDDQDKIRLSGIFRDVYLLHRPACHVGDFFAVPDLQGLDVCCRIEQPRGRVRMTLRDAGGESVAQAQMEASACVQARLPVPRPLLWSAETPNLYTLRIELEDEWIEQRVGLRTVSIEGGVFRVNGVPVKLLGVNRHDMNPDTGYAVTMDDMRRDLTLMKRSNVNCVRCSHYPNDPRFYELCDELGLYVIDEADMETHGCFYVGDVDWLMNDPAYEEAILDREMRLVERDKNHACVVIWSMGNESGWGKALQKASAWIRSRDGSRLIHMESAFNGQRRKAARACFAEVGPEWVDMVGAMYPSLETLRELLSYEEEKRPLLLTEYCHAMGNSLGGMKEYAEIIFEHPRMMGGCIWEWADHGLRDQNGRFLYGGDFGEKKHHNNICADGLVNPDREPHSALAELAQAYAPVVAEAFENSTLTLRNRWSFLSTQGMVIACALLVNGRQHAAFTVPCPAVAPLGTGEARLPLETPDLPGEKTLKVSFLRDGMAVSHAHFTLESGSFSARRGRQPLAVQMRGGMLKRLCAFGRVLAENVHPVIWRAPLDNDRYIRTIWQSAEGENIHVPCMTLRSCGQSEGETHARFALGGMSYKPVIDGEIRWNHADERMLTVAQRAKVREDYPRWLPRYGLCWKIPLAFSRVSYYGVGPQESYEDKRLSGCPGWYAYDALACRDNYVRPQESGSHCGAHIVCLTDENGRGMAVYSETPFSFSVQPHDLGALSTTAHPDELPEITCLYLYTDIRMSGVGSASVGPELPRMYRINPGDVLSHTLHVAAVDFSEEDPLELLLGCSVPKEDRA